MDSQSSLAGSASGRVAGRLAELNPHAGFLRRKIRRFVVAALLIGAAGGGLGRLLVAAQESLAEDDFSAKRVAVPEELRAAVVSAARGDAKAFQDLIPAHPVAALTLLIDQEHAPASMDFRNPLGAMPREASDRLVRECAALFPLEAVAPELRRVFRQRISRAWGSPNATREQERARLLLGARPDGADLLEEYEDSPEVRAKLLLERIKRLGSDLDELKREKRDP